MCAVKPLTAFRNFNRRLRPGCPSAWAKFEVPFKPRDLTRCCDRLEFNDVWGGIAVVIGETGKRFARGREFNDECVIESGQSFDVMQGR